MDKLLYSCPYQYRSLGIAILQSFIAYGIAKIIDEIPYIRTFLLGKQ